MFRGDAARNAPGAFSGKLGQREWNVQLVDGKDLDQLQRYRQSSLQVGVTPLPAVHALVVGNTVFTRSPNKLVALDFASGRRTWEFPWETQDKDAIGRVEHFLPGPGNNVISGMVELVYHSAPYGQLSSDGRLVFILDRLMPIMGRGTSGPFMMMGPGGPMGMMGQRPGSDP